VAICYCLVDVGGGRIAAAASMAGGELLTASLVCAAGVARASGWCGCGCWTRDVGCGVWSGVVAADVVGEDGGNVFRSNGRVVCDLGGWRDRSCACIGFK